MEIQDNDKRLFQKRIRTYGYPEYVNPAGRHPAIEEIFPNAEANWPLRSSDLTPLGYFL